MQIPCEELKWRKPPDGRNCENSSDCIWIKFKNGVKGHCIGINSEEAIKRSEYRV